MDIGQSISFAFKDENWLRKLGVGGLYVLASMFIIPIPILMGYQLATTRNTLRGDKSPLPSWDEPGELFSDGLKYIVAALAYASPIIVMSICIAVVAIMAAESGNDGLIGGGILVFQCITMLYSLLLAAIMPAVTLQYVEHGTIGACFNFSEIMDFTRRNIGNIILAWLTSVAAVILLQIAAGIGFITICGGIIIALCGNAWILAVRGHLYAQIALADDQWGKSNKEAFFDDFSY